MEALFTKKPFKGNTHGNYKKEFNKKKTFKFYNCDKEGHMAKDCRLKKRDYGNFKRNDGKDSHFVKREGSEELVSLMARKYSGPRS